MQRAKKQSNIDPNALFAGVAEMPTALDPEFERERTEAEEKQLQQEWDWDGSFDGLKSLPLSFKIHLGVSLLICVAVFLIFRYTASPSPSEAVPWWIFSWFIFTISLTGHYFFSIREYWKGSFLMVVILTVGLYLVNKTFTPEFDWYLIPLALASMVGTAFYLGSQSASLVKIMAHEYVMACIISFVIWINLQSLWTRFPWFVYPVCTLGMTLAVWAMYREYQIRKFYPYSLVVGVSITLQALFTWAFVSPSESTWPWWLLVFAFFGVLTLGLYIYTEGCYLCPPAPPEEPQDLPNTELDSSQQPQQELSLTQFLAKKAVESVVSKFSGS